MVQQTTELMRDWMMTLVGITTDVGRHQTCRSSHSLRGRVFPPQEEHAYLATRIVVIVLPFTSAAVLLLFFYVSSCFQYDLFITNFLSWRRRDAH
jgi:hypothetical protein